MNNEVGERVSESTLHLLSSMTTALGERKDLTEQQGLDYAIAKTLIKKYKHRRLLACLHCKYFGV